MKKKVLALVVFYLCTFTTNCKDDSKENITTQEDIIKTNSSNNSVLTKSETLSYIKELLESDIVYSENITVLSVKFGDSNTNLEVIFSDEDYFVRILNLNDSRFVVSTRNVLNETFHFVYDEKAFQNKPTLEDMDKKAFFLKSHLIAEKLKKALNYSRKFAKKAPFD